MTERLHKSKNNRMIAGVCGGIAEYFNVDATLIRLAWLLAVFFGGSGIVLYIIAMIIIPEKGSLILKEEIKKSAEGGETEKASEEKIQPVTAQYQDGNKQWLPGLILVGLGCYFLMKRFFPYYFNFSDWWPIILIIIGIGFLIRSAVNKK